MRLSRWRRLDFHPGTEVGVGDLGVIEWGDLPFEPKRVYWLSNTPTSGIRGNHAHKELEQVFAVMQGRVTVRLETLDTNEEFVLEPDGAPLYVAPGVWRELSGFAPGTVLLVLASLPFSKEDYIHSHEDFIRWVSCM